jgi:hypothetical protein
MLDSHCHPTCLSALLRCRAAEQGPHAAAYELQSKVVASDPFPAWMTL